MSGGARSEGDRSSGRDPAAKLRGLVRLADRTHRVDDHGIIHIDEQDFYYREVPRSFFDGIVAAPGRVEGIDAFVAALETLSPEQNRYVREYALDPTRAMVALLGNVGTERTFLDYGCGWGTITRAVSSLGGAVVAMDPTYESLLLSRFISNSDDELYIKGGRELPLPFENDAFDTVLLNGVLEWIPSGNMLDLDPRDVQTLYLREFLRVLRPGGRLVIAIENRHSFLYWAGQREDHTALRFGAVLPRFASNIYSRLLRGEPYRTYTYTRRGYRALLSRTGFVRAELWVPWLRYRRPEMLLSEQALAKHPLAPRMKGRTALGRMARRLLPLAQRSRLLHRFMPDYCIVTQKPPADGTSLVHRITGCSGDDDRAVAVTASSVPTLHVTTPGSFLKIPLTSQARERLKREFRAHALLQDTNLDLAAFTVDASACELAAGAAHGRFPRVDVADPRADDGPRKDALAGPFLDLLGGDARPVRLADTDYARRLEVVPHEELLRFIDAGSLRDLDVACAKQTPAGLVHGDLCRQNALLTARGTIVVVDWDRAEPCSPKLLDPLHWAVDASVKSGRLTLARVVRDAAQNPGDHMSARAMSLRGELSPGQMMLIYLVDRLTKDISASDASPWIELSGGSAARRAELCHGTEWAKSYRDAFSAVGNR